MAKYTYQIFGLHCPSCVLLIEDKLGKEKGIKSVNVDLKKQQLTLESEEIISVKILNKIFKDNDYQFAKIESQNSTHEDNTLVLDSRNLWWFYALIIIAFFLFLSKLGLAGFLNINSRSSLLSIFAFGLIAGFSSCGALLSGLILSAPKQTKKLLLGRIIAYTALGGVLGIIGSQFRLSSFLTTGLMLLVSLVMIVVALQMLEVKFARQINLFLPKSFGKKVTSQKLPFVMGLLTVFLPCGFTLLTESVAILSGTFQSGLLIMLVFVLGTSIPLFLIGLSSDKLIKNQKLIGALILFFVLYNLNFNFGLTQKVFGQNSLKPANQTSAPSYENAQVIKTTYTSNTDISPSSFTVKVGQPVRMEVAVNDNGSGCMSTIMVKGLYNKPQTLIKSQTIVMEFVPQKVGTYQITCAMGVPRGEINVVE